MIECNGLNFIRAWLGCSIDWFKVLVYFADMITVGAFEAKTHLSALLDKVAAGEEVVITKHGKVVAKLVKAAENDKAKIDDVIARIKEHRKRIRLGGLDWKALRDMGRK